MYRSILQTKEWATLKSKYGQTPHWISDVLVLEHKLPMGKCFLYIPEIDQVQLHDMDKKALDELALKTGAIFTRVEIVTPVGEKATYLDESLKGFTKSFEEVQPESRRILNLNLSEKEIFEQMKSKGRYNIRVAARHGVHVADYKSSSEHRVESISHELEFWGRSDDVKTAQEDSKKYAQGNQKTSPVRIFHQLYLDTVTREKIKGRSLDYFHDLVDILGARGYARVFIAYLKDEPLAAAVVTLYEGVASYLYGGSSRANKEVMAPFALHWVIIQEAKKCGCKSYDLLGIAPAEANEKHQWAGLTRFKENFGGTYVNAIGSYDKIYSPKWYWAYKIGEKLRGR
jgi:lipid II:glycine glycyltransferase (peptidoglycan interpeptide bridge formation enzyme)